MSKPKPGSLWQAYSADATNEQARRAFIARYGREPAEVWRNGGGVFAGPITKEEHVTKNNSTD